MMYILSIMGSNYEEMIRLVTSFWLAIGYIYDAERVSCFM